MINIIRRIQIPTSLKNPKIKKYLDDYDLHLHDPINYKKPEKPPSYRNSDLLDALTEDFFAKCYLTEEKFENAYIMDVEHFEGKAEKPELRYEWTNLFPASHYANMIKPRTTPTGDCLNPCDANDDVENEILYSLGFLGENPSFGAKNIQNIKAVNTAKLLDSIHNGRNENTKQATPTLRRAIQHKYITILKKIIEWQNIKDNPQQKFQIETELKLHLSRTSAFTMLCRSMPEVINSVPKDFLD
jgi:hypothetical protein